MADGGIPEITEGGRLGYRLLEISSRLASAVLLIYVGNFRCIIWFTAGFV